MRTKVRNFKVNKGFQLDVKGRGKSRKAKVSLAYTGLFAASKDEDIIIIDTENGYEHIDRFAESLGAEIVPIDEK